MAVDSLQITAETAESEGLPKVRGRPFGKGQSGNPAGRPRGTKNRATRIAQLLLDGEAAALSRKAIELALAGDAFALKLCLDRILAPQRHRAVELELPALRDAADLAGAMAAVSAAAARGEITPGEAVELAQVIDTAIRAYKTCDVERRRKAFWGGGS